jgi:hypothetical protein
MIPRMKVPSLLLLAVVLIAQPAALFAQDFSNDKFRQLEEILPSPNETRTASGSPGHRYWQQRADYVIDVELDDEKQRIIGHEKVTYRNNSPDTLSYLWMQLDPNLMSPDSDHAAIETAPSMKSLSYKSVNLWLTREEFDGGVNIHSVKGTSGAPLKYQVVKTMMRIDLPKPLKPGLATTFSVSWDYNINDAMVMWARTGYEYFKKDDNYIYEIAQWFPRMAAYTDYTGWQHKQFLGRGEFTLEFGDYEVNITVPEDHVVSATGVLQNEQDVLTKTQQERLKKSKTAKTPMFVITPDEAKANEKKRGKQKQTWRFKAENVRDFAFASSRKFIWDAQGYKVGGKTVMAMSFYPNEAEPLWSKYSTHAIIHTLDVYSRYTFNYPYPVAVSINGPVGGGMEYPMVCFNKPRPEEDGTYDKRTKLFLISVVIHEVGHNYFPMIVNSDERQWTWMDEGLNSFLQYLAEQEWEQDYPSRSGNPEKITGYMKSEMQVPIMMNSESILQFGPNAYAKPATALNILRETILGRELFDFAFKEYARRWEFKRPQPADFFRTMEDASGIDLDWFWRGWFFTTDHVDIAIDQVHLYQVDTQDPVVDKRNRRQDRDEHPKTVSSARNEGLSKRVDRFPELKDFYNKYDELDVTQADREKYDRLLKGLTDRQKDLLKTGRHFYVVDFENIGGLVMPIILEVEYADGSKEELRYPAEIWLRNAEKTSKVILSKKEIRSIVLDPHLETADCDVENNYFPRRPVKSRIQLKPSSKSKNPMQRARDAAKKKKAATATKPAPKKPVAKKPAPKKPVAKKPAPKKTDN